MRKFLCDHASLPYCNHLAGVAAAWENARNRGVRRVNVSLIATAAVGAGRQILTSYLVNDRLAVDAGTVGLLVPVEAQTRVRDIIITHSHLDHVASLPVFLDNVYSGTADAVTIHGTAPVLESLQRDFFNGRVWPDYIGLSRSQAPFLRLALLEPGRPVVLEGLRITPVPVNHVVPTIGLLIDDGSSAVVFSSDTAPTEALWQVANAASRLNAVFLEVSFPDEMAGLAEIAMHLTPRLFAAEVAKLRRPAQLFAVHIKPRYHEQIVAELMRLGLDDLNIVEPGQTYAV
jgi:ribonuclease BN (tRNA processing enzyme)